MRFSELSLWICGAAALAAGLAGCSSTTPATPGAGVGAAKVEAAPAAQAPASAPSVGTPVVPAATAASAAAQPAPPAAPPVDAVTQRAFDDARRAMAAGRTNQAEKGFRALTQSHPDLGGPHANLGMIYRRESKLAESAMELEQAVKLSPQQPTYLTQLGVTYRLLGEFTKAREAYEKAIRLDANSADAYLNLGVLYDLYLWDGKRALELYEKYLSMTPGGDPLVSKWIVDLKTRIARKGAGNREDKK